MSSKKILVIGMYPIAKSLHGGQKRVRAIVDLYRDASHEVRYVGVFHRGHYPEWEASDMPLGQLDIIRQVDANIYATELLCGEAIDKDIHIRSAMALLLTQFKPDIIHIEQPYPYIGLKVLLTELNMSPCIIYGSQDTEYLLKQRIFKNLRVPRNIANPIIEKTKKLEQTLSREADLVAAVSKSYLNVHIKMGAKNYVVAPNGIQATKSTKKSEEYWLHYFEDNNIKHAVTFVGSGHPPNWEDFSALIGLDTTFMPAKSKLIIAGGVSSYFNEHYGKKKDLYPQFWAAADVVGVLEEDSLAALLDASSVIILPIQSQHGSNLKTAEALLSDKKIVATSNAFKGFEQYRRLPNIFVGNTKTSFQACIRKALITPRIKRTTEETMLASGVQWEQCLYPLLQAMEKLSPHPKNQTRTLKLRLKSFVDRLIG